jgi:glycosyltransferase involved in cell wall biosynthesis
MMNPDPVGSNRHANDALFNPTCDVILPALNEAGALPYVLTRMPRGYRAIVVDNGSTDDTVSVATAHGALVVHASQRGFGAACWAGLQAATADVIAFMDADASFDSSELPRVVDPVLAGSVDLMMGSRQPERGAWPVHARFANRVLTFEIRRRSNVAVTDMGPMRSMHRTALLELGMKDRRSGWPLEMVMRADRAGWRIDEVPVTYRPRIGKSKVTGTVRGTARAIGDMSRILAHLD